MSKDGKKLTKAPKVKASHWSLHSGLFEIYWKVSKNGLYAARVRVNGVTFYFTPGEREEALEVSRGTK